MQQHKVVIIGGTSGMGLATAQLLTSTGAQVIAVGRERDKAVKLRAENPGLIVETLDAASGEALKTFYSSLGNFTDLVLCVSGAKGSGPFAALQPDDLLTGFQEKFFAQFRSAQAALPFLSKNGSVTFVSAISARGSMPGTAGLAAINGAIEAMVKPLAKELRPLRVNAVSPGVVETTWWDRVPKETREQLLQQSAAQSMVGRNGQPDDLADAIAFLIRNDFVTGTVLEIDGGLHFA